MAGVRSQYHPRMILASCTYPTIGAILVGMLLMTAFWLWLDW
jgi:hypothetical protein